MGVGGREREPQRRDRGHQQQRGGEQGDESRAAHDAAGEPVPAALLGGLGGARGGALEASWGERVDAGAERDEHGGEHEQRDEAGGERHDGAADAHRVEEADREDEHRGEGACDGERAVEDGAAGGLERAEERLAGVGAGGELLAVAGEHEQGVVDAEARGPSR